MTMTATRQALLALLCAFALLVGCGGNGGGGGGGGGGHTGGGGGNDATRTLTVTPKQSSFEPQQTVQLTATTENITTPAITYEVVPPTALAEATAEEIALQFGSVDANGLFTGGEQVAFGARGSIVVTETTSALQQTVALLAVPPIQTVTVEPDSAAVLAGQTVGFTASAIDFFGDPVSPILVDWQVTGGVGIISNAGIFTGQQAGEGQVQARVGLAQPGTATVTVVGSIVGLSITPTGNPVEVETGTTRQFTALVRDAQGNQSEVTATWSLSDAALGTVSAAGLFTAGTVGATGTIMAEAEGQTATVPLSVVALLVPPNEQPMNVSGTVRQPDTSLASGATVTVTTTAEPPEVLGQVTTGADGKYGFFLPVGTYTIQAILNNLAAIRTPVDVPSQDVRQEVNLTLQAQ